MATMNFIETPLIVHLRLTSTTLYTYIRKAAKGSLQSIVCWKPAETYIFECTATKPATPTLAFILSTGGEGEK